MAFEWLYPRHRYPRDIHWNKIWVALCMFSSAWLSIVVYYWAQFDTANWLSGYGFTMQCVVFYLIYSCGNYWLHRWKHSNRLFMKYIHGLHHAPENMETRLAFFRHPVEILVNTVYFVLLGKFAIGAPIEVAFCALVIEGCLESFHHSNIRLSKECNWMGYMVQLPEMHCIHHEKGRHRNNYSPLLWDSIFGTVEISGPWEGKLGLKGPLKNRLLYRGQPSWEDNIPPLNPKLLPK